MKDIINKMNNNELIDENDFRQIALSFCEEKGFPFLLNDVIFDSEYQDIGAHRPISKILIFNFDKVCDLANKGTYKLLDIYKRPNESFNIFQNFYLLYVLYHELRHIEQDYNRDCNINYNPAFIYLKDIGTVAAYDQVAYHKFHDLFPFEIDANNFGYIYSYIELAKSNINNIDKNILLLQVYNSLLLHYSMEKKKIISPIQKFDEKVGYIDLEHLYDLMKKNKIDSSNKFAHGLPVNKYEYYKLCIKKKRTLKTIIR